jgi:hypothetical protein
MRTNRGESVYSIQLDAGEALLLVEAIQNALKNGTQLSVFQDYDDNYVVLDISNIPEKKGK